MSNKDLTSHRCSFSFAFSLKMLYFSSLTITTKQGMKDLLKVQPHGVERDSNLLPPLQTECFNHYPIWYLLNFMLVQTNEELSKTEWKKTRWKKGWFYIDRVLLNRCEKHLTLFQRGI